MTVRWQASVAAPSESATFVAARKAEVLKSVDECLGRQWRAWWTPRHLIKFARWDDIAASQAESDHLEHLVEWRLSPPESMTADEFVDLLGSGCLDQIEDLLRRRPQVVATTSRPPRPHSHLILSWSDLDGFLCEHATTILRDHGEGRSYGNNPDLQPYKLNLRHLMEHYPASTWRAEAFKLAAIGTETRRELCQATWGCGWADVLAAKADSYGNEIPPARVHPENEIRWRKLGLRIPQAAHSIPEAENHPQRLPTLPDSSLFSWRLAQRIRCTQPVGEKVADL